MSYLAADDALLALLNQAKDLVEVRDAEGNPVGYFAPVSTGQARDRVKSAACAHSKALKGASNSAVNGDPLEVVLARLKILEREMENRREAGLKEFTKEEALAFFRSLRRQDAPGNAVLPSTES